MSKCDEDIRIILRLSNEHQNICSILSKHWEILTEELSLMGLATKNPQITYRRAGSLGEILTQSEYRGDQRKDPCKVWGYYPCGLCLFCAVIGQRKSLTLPNGECFHFKHFANCKTQGVVYLLSCQCGVFYVGKTRQELSQPVGKHLASMKICNLYLLLGIHVAKCYGYRMPAVNCTVLDRVHNPLRGGDWNKMLLQREMRWVKHLDATIPPGLNKQNVLDPFWRVLALVKPTKTKNTYIFGYFILPRDVCHLSSTCPTLFLSLCARFVYIGTSDWENVWGVLFIYSLYVLLYLCLTMSLWLPVWWWRHTLSSMGLGDASHRTGISPGHWGLCYVHAFSLGVAFSFSVLTLRVSITIAACLVFTVVGLPGLCFIFSLCQGLIFVLNECTL